MRYKKRRKSKNRNRNKDVTEDEIEEHDNIPRSFVIHHGSVSANVDHLVTDFKSVMKPNTAERLKARKRNTIKDFVAMAGPLKVSHLIIFSQTDCGPNLKIGRFPQGPTLSFRIENYTLARDVLLHQKKQMTNKKTFGYSPCLMTNLQPTEGDQHLQLCGKLFLDMFPSINPATVKTHHIKRCCLINYNKDDNTFDFRHYAVTTRPVGISKATRKLISSKVPNLGNFNEVADYVTKSEVLSDSEGEEDPSAHVIVRKEKKDKVLKQKSVIKLSEIGPRLTLKLLKIESGLCEGTILYHNYIIKTAEEVLKLERQKKKRERLRQMRRKQQEENVKRKVLEKEAHKKKCLQGMGIEASLKRKNSDYDENAEDDLEYYRQEVGEEPDEDLFQRPAKKKAFPPKKKFKNNQ